MKTKKQRTKEQHDLMRLTKKFQENQLPKVELKKDRARNKKITIDVADEETE